MSTRRLAKVPLFGNAAKAVTVEAGATVGAQIGVNLLMPDGSPATTAKLQALFGDGAPSDGSINTTDDLEEGQWNLWFTDRRAQDAVGGILADTATIDLAYTAGTSITATLKDLADSGTGAALVKITRDGKGRISGTEAATTTDLTEGTNLYFTDARVRATALTGLSTATATPVTATDSVLVGVGKLQGQASAAATAIAGKEPSITPGTTAQYWRGDKNWRDFATDVRAAVLTGLSTATNAVIAATDTVLSALGKLQAQITANLAALTGHTSNTSNPHGVTKAQVGLGNVDNTSDADKPVSTAQAAALGTKADKATTLAGYGITDAIAEKGQVTNLNTLAGSCVFGFGNTAIGAPSAGSYDATGVQWSETGQVTQLVSLSSSKGAQLLIRVDDGSGFSNWSAVLTDLNSGDFATSAQGAKADSAVQPNTSPTLAGTVVITGGSQAGGGHLDLAGGSDYKIRMNSNLFLQASSSNWGFWNDSAGAWDIRIGIAAPDLTVRGRVLPTSDNALTCGASGLRWSVVYAATGTINTSDAREKTDVAPLTAEELAAASDLARAIGTYQWLESLQLKGADARHHAGLTVQQAIAIMQTHGLDPFRYGFICFDEWAEQLEQVDEETGEVTQAYRPAGDRYSFRHDELLLFIARGFAARLDALETAR